jgi:hypothetical protein
MQHGGPIRQRRKDLQVGEYGRVPAEGAGSCGPVWITYSAACQRRMSSITDRECHVPGMYDVNRTVLEPCLLAEVVKLEVDVLWGIRSGNRNCDEGMTKYNKTIYSARGIHSLTDIEPMELDMLVIGGHIQDPNGKVKKY